MSIKDRASVSESLKGGGGVNIEDCFSTYVYTGNDSLQTVSNGLNLADDGGLTITRCRDSATMWHVQDTERVEISYYIQMLQMLRVQLLLQRLLLQRMVIL